MSKKDSKNKIKNVRIGTYFNLIISDDEMQAYIPLGENIPDKLGFIKYEEFCHLFTTAGLAFAPLKEKWQELMVLLRGGTITLEDNFPILEGEHPKSFIPSSLEMVSYPKRPRDHAVAREPFTKLIPARLPEPGKNLFGKMVMPPVENIDEATLSFEYPPVFELNADGYLVPTQSGRVSLENNMISFVPKYTIEDPNVSDYHDVILYGEVYVTRDLPPQIHWVIYGKLFVHGIWMSPFVEVFGDVVVEAGIQTQSQDPVRIFGDCRTSYIQHSVVGIAGNLTLSSGIVQSDVRVGGNIICKGDPGSMVGCDIGCFGSIQANKVGSDQGRRSRIMVYDMPLRNQRYKVKIDTITSGTSMMVYDKEWVQKNDAPFES